MKQSELYNSILESEFEDVSTAVKNRDIKTAYSIRDAYKDWISELPDVSDVSGTPRQVSKAKDRKYEEALNLASKADYSQGDLYNFLELDWRETWDEDAEGYDWNANSLRHGIFPSAFVEQLDREEIRVPDMTDIFEFGYRNSKDMVVEGNVGDSFGMMMEGGTVRIEGGSDLNLGHTMRGGEIIIEGSAEGIWNPKGKIVVQGDVTHNAYQIEGELRVKGDLEEVTGDSRIKREGEIRVEGEIKSINEERAEGTKVYQKQNGGWERVFP